jgi:hypothetical protein
MRLTVEDHREAIKRYSHVRPARGSKAGLCSTLCPGTRRTCTLGKGHRGPHVAHGLFKRVVAVWESETGARVSKESIKRAARAKSRSGVRTGRPIGLRTGRPVGILGALWERVLGTIGSVEQIAFLVFFLAFVGFAIHWFLLILG